jgi:Cadherin domain.
VTDINDKNPEFTDLPYVFRVHEGEANKKVGNVHAVDADEGQNAVIYYTVPGDIPFSIDAMTGEIRTKVALDYEKQRVSWTPTHLVVLLCMIKKTFCIKFSKM